MASEATVNVYVGRRRRNASPRKEKAEKTAVGVGVGNPSIDSGLKFRRNGAQEICKAHKETMKT